MRLGEGQIRAIVANRSDCAVRNDAGPEPRAQGTGDDGYVANEKARYRGFGRSLSPALVGMDPPSKSERQSAQPVSKIVAGSGTQAGAATSEKVIPKLVTEAEPGGKGGGPSTSWKLAATPTRGLGPKLS